MERTLTSLLASLVTAPLFYFATAWLVMAMNRDAQGPDSGLGADEADYLTVAVGLGQGAYTIPTAYFMGVNTLDVLIALENSVTGNNAFMKGSAISSNRTGMYRIAIIA